MQWGPFLPLFLLFLWRYFRSGSGRDLALYALFFAWNAIACVHYGVFGAIALAVTLALVAIERPHDFGARAGRFALATGAATAALLPFALPYIRASRLYHFQRGLQEVVFYSATWKAFLSAGVRSRVYGNLTAPFAAPETELFFGLVVPVLAIAGFVWSPRRDGVVPPEPRRNDAKIAFLDATILILAVARAAFAVTGGFRIGFFRVHEPYRLSMALCVAVIARLVWAFPRSARHPHLPGWLRARNRAPATTWAVSMIVVGVIVALGANFFPYREMYEMFRPVLASIRAPGRGIVLAHLGIGVLAAQGVSALRARRTSSRLLVPALAVGLILAELRAAPLLLADAIPAVPSAVRWTDAQAFAGGVLELPMKVSDDCTYVLWAAEHDFPIVNGYSGFFPPEHQRLAGAFEGSLPAAETAASLSENDVAVVLFHRGRALASERKAVSGLLLRLCATGALRPVQRMGTGADDTVICAVVRRGTPFPSSDSGSAAAFDALARPLAGPGRPQGWFYEPRNGAHFRGDSIRGSGWAASDDGIARIEVWLDGKNVGAAAYGRYHPDVPMVKPYVACGAFCGYDYRIEHVSAGRHVLGYRYVGKNGGVATPPDVEIWVRP